MDLNEHLASAALLLGIILVTIGTAAYDWRLGFIAAGTLLLLSIRSLWRWIK